MAKNVQRGRRKRQGGVILSAEQHEVLRFLEKNEHKAWSADAIASATGLRVTKVVDAIAHLRRRDIRSADDARDESRSPLVSYVLKDPSKPDERDNRRELDMRTALLKKPPPKYVPPPPDPALAQKDAEIAALRAMLAERQPAPSPPLANAVASVEKAKAPASKPAQKDPANG